MGNLVQIDTPSLTPQAASTISLLASWEVYLPLPAGLTTDRLGADLACVEAVCEPVSRQQFRDAIGYLVAAGQRLVAQQPGFPDPLEIYFLELKEYPAAVVRRAARSAARSHVWDSPVKPAELIQAAENDTEWRRLRAAKAKLSTAKWRAHMLERDAAPRAARKTGVAHAGASPSAVPPTKPRIKAVPRGSLSDADLWQRKVALGIDNLPADRPLSPTEVRRAALAGADAP